MFIGIAFYAHSQPSLTLPDNTPPIEIIKGEWGNVYYRIPLARASVIDYWARRGINSRDNAIYLEELFDNVKKAKQTSDSLAIALNSELLATQAQVDYLLKENKNLNIKAEYCNILRQRLEKDLILAEDKNKRLKKKLFWKNASLIGTYVAGGVVAALLLTR